jgi:hypothetical protein
VQNQSKSYYKKCPSENGLEGSSEEIDKAGRGVKVRAKPADVDNMVDSHADGRARPIILE